MSAAPDVDHMFITELARKVYKCFKKVMISENGDATVLDNICLNSVIMMTLENLKQNLTEKNAVVQSKAF